MTPHTGRCVQWPIPDRLMCAQQAVAGLGPRRPRRAYGLLCAQQAVAGLGPRRPTRAYGSSSRPRPGRAEGHAWDTASPQFPARGWREQVGSGGACSFAPAARRFGCDIEWTTFDWSCERYTETGRMMPEDGLDRLRPFEAIFLGAVGFPGVPDHVSLWGLLIPIRRGFHQYVNLRPVRLLKGARSPLAGRGPADIDMVIVRENNEGEYSEIGGRLYRGTPEELAVQQSVFTRRGCDRIMRYAFELAM